MCQVSFTMTNVNECEVAQSCPTLCYSMNTRLLRPCDFLGKSTEVGCHFLRQGIFPTRGSNPGLQHYRQTLYHLSHQGSPFLPWQEHIKYIKQKHLHIRFHFHYSIFWVTCILPYHLWILHFWLGLYLYFLVPYKCSLFISTLSSNWINIFITKTLNSLPCKLFIFLFFFKGFLLLLQVRVVSLPFNFA